MTNPTVSDYLKYANLQMAAEAFLKDELTGEERYSGGNLITALKAGNKRSFVFTQPQADAFAAQWEVVDQRANTNTGFSGTLFRNKAHPNELVLSFRSTEFIDDHARDNKATNDLELAGGGFALGQIADMEAWYAQLSSDTGALRGKTYSVTGYSLGAHLATVFNQLRQAERQAGPPPAATLDQVITFNGAGVGQIGNGTLRGLIDRFTALRTQAATTQGLAGLFITTKGKEIYAQLRADFVANNHVLTGAMRDRVATAFGTIDEGNTLLKADYDLLLGANGALYRALKVASVATDIPQLGSGSTAVKPTDVPHIKIAAEDIDYQLAVVTAQAEYRTRVTNIAVDGLSLLLNGGVAKVPATPALSNQFDVVGWEYSAQNPVAVVAHSLWHYGQDVKQFIEDQPNVRNGVVGAVAAASIAAGDFRPLVDGFGVRDFGDDHSLTLIVDSLNVQNVLLNLIPVPQREAAGTTLLEIFKNASWRRGVDGSSSGANAQGQAEGDVLENVVNALADLILGPQIKVSRLNGSPDGNTWWDTTNITVGETSYSGRDAFYAKLKAITDRIAEKNLTGKLTLAPSAASLQDRARNDYFAYAALASLSPFVFKPAASIDVAAMSAAFGASYITWQTDRDAVASGKTASIITDQWIADRAAFLERKNWFNDKNIKPLDPGYVHNSTANPYQNDDVFYWDVASDYRMAQGVVGNATRHFYFGDEEANTFAGRGVDDHIFGGAGDDTLSGNYGDDYLEGNDGNDTLDGGVNADTLVGGNGADSLAGGAGFDTYIVGQLSGAAANPDIDTVTDDDGKGILKDSAGRLIAGSFVPKDGGGYVMLGNSAITANGDGALAITLQNGAKVVLQNFGELPGGELGIHRYEVASGGTLIRGDLAPVDQNTNTSAIDIGYDPLGNVKVSTTEAPNRADTLYGSESADSLRGLGGNDIIYGRSGNDVIEGGANNTDRLMGEAGDDIIWGNDAPTGTTVVLDAFNSANSGPSDYADWLDGGIGNDILIANTAVSGMINLLTGGEGHDLLIGGAGNDFMLGDAALTSAEQGWGVTRTVESDNLYSWTIHLGSVSESDSQGGADALYGGTGEDWLLGGAGDDLLDGGDHKDVLSGEAGNDILLGGGGDDIISGDSAGLDEALHGDDWLSGGDGVDTLYGNGGADVIIGGNGNDTIYGGAGRDTYIFNKGDGVDTIYDDDSGPEKSILIFGAGFDPNSIKLRTGSLLLDLGNGDAIHIENWDQANPLANQSFQSFQFADGTSLSWESLLERGFDLDGTEGDDEITGTGLEDRIDGKAGNDLIWALDGNDIITGGTGTDGMSGGLGDDVYLLNAGDGLVGRTADDQPSFETILDEGGEDTISFAADVLPASLNLVADTNNCLTIEYGSDDVVTIADGLSGAIEQFTVGAGATAQTRSFTQFVGEFGSGLYVGTDGAGHLHLTGGKTDDSLISLAGDAVVSGGRGDDLLQIHGTANTIHYSLGDGSDRVQTSASANPGNVLTLSGVTADDLALGLGPNRELELRVGGDTADAIRFATFNAANVQAPRHALESRRWRDGEQDSRAANDLQWRRQA